MMRSKIASMNRAYVCAALVLIQVVVVHVEAEAAGWKAGVAKAVITPKKPMWMAGYGGRNKPAEGKTHDLWIKVLALEDARGNVGVVLTSDLLGVSKPIYDNTCRTLKERFGLQRSQIMLTASHTHCGPVIRSALYDIYPLDEAQIGLIEEYSSWLEEQIVKTVAEALERRAPATVSMGSGVARFAVNRRNNREAEVPKIREQGASLKGPIDHSVPVLAVRSPDERLIAVVFGYACHNTTLSFYNWCGDYAGFAQIELEKRHPGAAALFYMGCGADQNPLPRRTVELCQNYGRQLADAVDDVLRNSARPVEPTLTTGLEMIDLELGDAPTREELSALAKPDNYRGRWARRLLKELDAGKTFLRTYPYPVQAWKLGRDQWWVTLGGEVVVDFSLRLKKEIDPNMWVTGYANDVMAYIPSLRVLREGGYEGQSSMMVYGMPAHRWAENVEERIVETVHRLHDQVNEQSQEAPRIVRTRTRCGCRRGLLNRLFRRRARYGLAHQ